MFKNYKGLWLLLAVAFAVFAALSFMEPVSIGGNTLKQSGIAEALTPKPHTDAAPADSAAAPAAKSAAKEPVPVDTASKTLLFIGDSMLEGLSPRLAAYAKANGHKMYTVMWYSSTSEIWGGSGKIAQYKKRLNPDYIFICLGANELFVRDIKTKRDKYVKKMVQEIGSTPFLWIGPPNWKPDTGINDLIAANVPQGSFFLSDGMHFERSKDGAHPTRSSAIEWMDSVVRWMPAHSNHPIRLDLPAERTARPLKIFVHQPNER